MSGDGVERLPKGWSWSSLCDCADSFQYGSSARTNRLGGVPVLRMGNIQEDGSLELSDLKYLPSRHDEFPALFLTAGDLLFNRTNSAELVGKTAVYRGSPSPCSFASYLIRVRLHEGIQPTIIAAWLNSRLGKRWVKSVVNQTVGQANVNGTKLGAFTFPLPPRSEQRRIADALDELLSDLEAGVGALERARAKLKQYRAAVLKAAVEGALTAEWRAAHPDAEPASVLLARILAERRRRWEETQLEKFKKAGKEPPKNWKAKYQEPVTPDTANLPRLPEGWCWGSMDQIGETQGGLQKSPARSPRSNHFPYLRVANVLRGVLSLDDLHRFELTDSELDRLRLETGDLLIVEGNGSRTEVGRCAMWRGDVADCVHQNHIIRVRPLGGMIPKYIDLFLNSPTGQRTIQWVASSTSGLYTLSVVKIEKLPLAIPPTSEQDAIVEAVEDQLSVIEHLEADIEAKLMSAQVLRQSILRHAFTGKLVPQDPNDESAGALLKRIAAEREERARLQVVARKARVPARRSRKEEKT